MLDELREHQDLVAACEQLVQGRGEGRELGARRRPRILHQAGVAAREPQPREVREDLQPAIAHVWAHAWAHVCGTADRIVVLDAGRTEEAGSHDGLIAPGGLYSRLVGHGR